MELDKEEKEKVEEALGTDAGRNKELMEEVSRLREIVEGYAKERREYIIEQRKPSNTLRFALTGDSHIGSLYERVDALEKFYKTCKDEGITEIYNAGDVIDGHKMYRGMEFEQYAHGYDAQAKAFQEKFPKIEGIRTIFVTGNHDASYQKEVGANIGNRLQELRPDCQCIGADYGRVVMFTKQKRPFTLHLFHPSGGSSYAISYRSQKLVESLPGGLKPNMIAIGHFHKAEWLPQYRNVSTFQVGCFQSQTPFMARKPTPAHMGGWIIEVVIGKREELVMRVKGEFISFYEPGEVEEIKMEIKEK